MPSGVLGWESEWLGEATAGLHLTPMPTRVAQVQGLCGTFTWNQKEDFLTPVGDVETSIAAFISKFQLAGQGRCASEDIAPLSPCRTRTQLYVSTETARAILHGPTFQAASWGCSSSMHL